MLDDLHALQSPACHDVLSVLISAIPRGSQLVAASRSEQPHLPRLRALGDVLEVVAGDLALDAAGAEQIFSQAHVDITHELAAAVTARTEGWPVGLYLAAVIARASRGGVLTISGDDRYVADYLYGESLAQLPDGVQRFLRRTAVLDQLSAPLCDAILEESGSGRGCAIWKPGACSWSRSIVIAAGIAITRCSESSCSVSFAESSPSPSRSCTCAQLTGMSPTDRPRWPSKTC